MNKKVYLSVSELAVRIAALGVAARDNQAEAHTLAVSALSHIAEHGDYRGIVDLANALPKAFRREALCVWAGEMTGGKLVIRFDKDAGQYVGKLHGGWNVEGVIDLEAAEATPFYELTQEARVGKTKGFDDLMRQIKNWANNDKLNEDGTPKVSDQARDAAAQLVAFVEKRHVIDLTA